MFFVGRNLLVSTVYLSHPKHVPRVPSLPRGTQELRNARCTFVPVQHLSKIIAIPRVRTVLKKRTKTPEVCVWLQQAREMPYT